MSLITSLIGPVTGILDKVIEDKDQKAKLAFELSTMADTHAQQALLAQLEINKAEAASEHHNRWQKASSLRMRQDIRYACILAGYSTANM